MVPDLIQLTLTDVSVLDSEVRDSELQKSNIRKMFTKDKPCLDQEQLSLQLFLSEEEVSLNDVSNLIGLTEDLVAMRNLGKTNEEIWKDVRRCRYLRGYDPPEMCIEDKDTNRFVFGMSMEETYQQHLLRVAECVEAARRMRQAEADAASYRLTASTSPTEKDVPSLDLTQYKTYMRQFL